MNSKFSTVNSNTFYTRIFDTLDKALPSPTENTPYETLNPLKSGVSQRRDSNTASMRNMLFEFDSISLEKQKQIIEKNKQYINRVVFSGNKSYHIRITLEKEPESIDEYKHIWKKINADLFEEKADIQCKTPSHLTRCPDAIRENGEKQSLYFYNEYCFFDADKYHELFKYENADKKVISTSVRNVTPENTDNILTYGAEQILKDNFPAHKRVEILKDGIPVLLRAGYSIDEIKQHIMTISEPDRRYDSLNLLDWYSVRFLPNKLSA